MTDVRDAPATPRDHVVDEPRRGHLGLSISVASFAAAIFGLSLAAVNWAPRQLPTAVWWPAAGFAVAIVAKYWSRRVVLVAASDTTVVEGSVSIRVSGG